MVAAFDPPYQRAFIDRLLVGVECDALPTVIAVNKIDLADGEERAAIARDLDVYRALDYPALAISADTGEGMVASSAPTPASPEKATISRRVSPIS